MNEGEWFPPKWMYRDQRPDDEGYFENLTRVIFQAGLNWKVIDNKWSDFKRAFRSFDIDKVAKFGSKEIERLMIDTGIVRNKAKIIATIENSKQFQKIRKEFGSFQGWLDTLDKSDNYALIVKELQKTFSRIGPSTAQIFLYSVGEDIKH